MLKHSSTTSFWFELLYASQVSVSLSYLYRGSLIEQEASIELEPCQLLQAPITTIRPSPILLSSPASLQAAATAPLSPHYSFGSLPEEPSSTL